MDYWRWWIAYSIEQQQSGSPNYLLRYEICLCTKWACRQPHIFLLIYPRFIVRRTTIESATTKRERERAMGGVSWFLPFTNKWAPAADTSKLHQSQDNPWWDLFGGGLCHVFRLCSISTYKWWNLILDDIDCVIKTAIIMSSVQMHRSCLTFTKNKKA